MSITTTDPAHPGLSKGYDESPRPQSEAYLVLPKTGDRKRPLRHSYRHVGERPKYELRDLTDEEATRYAQIGYVKYEVYPESESPLVGRYWTRAQLEAPVCGGVTTVSDSIAETYARDPSFYGSTYCCRCGMHRPVSEFVWVEDGAKVGT